MKTRLKKATPFVVSLTLHLAALLFVSFNLPTNGGNSNEQQGQQGGPIEVEMVSEEKGSQPEGSNEEIVPKQAEVEEELAQTPPPPEPEDITIPEEEKPKPIEDAVTECENDMWYGGIGIQQDWRTGQLEQVYQGYPADLIGLKVGDMIQTVDGVSDSAGGRIRGEPGTTITIGIFRPSTNEYLTFTFKRDKICLGKRL